jgi:hypothetical protein
MRRAKTTSARLPIGKKENGGSFHGVHQPRMKFGPASSAEIQTYALRSVQKSKSHRTRYRSYPDSKALALKSEDSSGSLSEDSDERGNGGIAFEDRFVVFDELRAFDWRYRRVFKRYFLNIWKRRFAQRRMVRVNHEKRSIKRSILDFVNENQKYLEEDCYEPTELFDSFYTIDSARA